MKYVFKILTFLIAVLMGMMFVTVATAPKARAASCTTLWLTTPTIYGKLQAGQKRCIDLTDGIYDDQIIRVYSFDDKSRGVIDWMDRWAHTTLPPNHGRYQPTADWIRYLAKQYGMRVQFGDRDQLGRLGCASSSGFTNSVSATYMPSGRYPGKGLIRIGTGTTDRCMRYKVKAASTAKFEFSRAFIERICGTPGPPMAGTSYLKIAAVTSAYAQKYLNATGYGTSPTANDFWRATQIHNGNCGS